MRKNFGILKFVIMVMVGALFAITVGATANSAAINREDLIYFLMTDRFCDGDPSNNQNVLRSDSGAYHGGDFQGIIAKLDYIRDLGFTTIWISPVVDNQIRGYHGYWAIDFYKTDEHFGSLAKLQELVSAAHAKKIKVIVDLVVNHTGHLHPWVGEPQYENWFHDRGNITNWNDQQEVEEGKLAGLPDLNQANPEVKRYLINMAKWWIRQTGIDGYRLDTVRHVAKTFWKEFSREIKKEFPDFYLIGEVNDGRPAYVAEYQKAGLDGLVDFPLYYAINDVFGGSRPVGRLTRLIEQCAASYPDRNQYGTFIDNHDVPRFISQLGKFGDKQLKQALAFMMTYTGIPIMYYGTEIGLDGGADPDNRRDMDWSVQAPLTQYVKRLTSIRKANQALTHGDLQIIKAETDCLCYLRRFENNTVIVIFNLAEQKKRVVLTLPRELQADKALLNELTGSKNLAVKQGKVSLTMSPRQVNIYKPEH